MNYAVTIIRKSNAVTIVQGQGTTVIKRDYIIQVNQSVSLQTLHNYTFHAPLSLSYPDVIISKSSESVDGYLSADDWNIFNAKQNAIILGNSAQYFRGDLSLATFPTLLSEFTNDEGFISGIAWGDITGNINLQLDLKSALDLKYDSSNPSGYQTASQVSSLIASTIAGYATQSWVISQGYLTSVNGEDHSSLDNLDYDHSGHTGFQPAGSYLTDAPSDGKQYARKDASWSEVETSGGMVYPGSGIAKSTGSAWTASITDNSSNWNTAYSWGNHADAGYLTSLTGLKLDQTTPQITVGTFTFPEVSTPSLILDGSGFNYLKFTEEGTGSNNAWGISAAGSGGSHILSFYDWILNLGTIDSRCGGLSSYINVTGSGFIFDNNGSAGQGLFVNITGTNDSDKILSLTRATSEKFAVNALGRVTANGGAVFGDIVLNSTTGLGTFSSLKVTNLISALIKADSDGDLIEAEVGIDYLTKATNKFTRTVVIDYDGSWDSEEIPLMDLSDVACTITAVRACVLGTSTPTLTFNIEERPWGTDINTAGTVITSSAMVADADGLEQTSFSNAGIAAKAHLVLTTGTSAATGSVLSLVITIDYTKD